MSADNARTGGVGLALRLSMRRALRRCVWRLDIVVDLRHYPPSLPYRSLPCGLGAAAVFLGARSRFRHPLPATEDGRQQAAGSQRSSLQHDRWRPTSPALTSKHHSSNRRQEAAFKSRKMKGGIRQCSAYQHAGLSTKQLPLRPHPGGTPVFSTRP